MDKEKIHLLFLVTCMEPRWLDFLLSTSCNSPEDLMLEHGPIHTSSLQFKCLPNGPRALNRAAALCTSQVLLIHLTLWAEMWLDQGKEPSLPFLLHLGRRKRQYFLLLEKAASSNYCPPPSQGHYQQRYQAWPWWKQSIQRGSGLSAILVLRQLASTGKSQLCSHKNHTELSFHLTVSQLYLTFCATPVVYKVLNMHKQSSKPLLNTLITVLSSLI